MHGKPPVTPRELSVKPLREAFRPVPLFLYVTRILLHGRPLSTFFNYDFPESWIATFGQSIPALLRVVGALKVTRVPGGGIYTSARIQLGLGCEDEESTRYLFNRRPALPAGRLGRKPHLAREEAAKTMTSFILDAPPRLWAGSECLLLGG